jgi:lipoprotein-anchoring transpeptidase ErfK/SrfK
MSLTRRNALSLLSSGAIAGVFAGTGLAIAKTKYNFSSESGGTKSTYRGKRTVKNPTGEKPGTVVIYTRKRKLYFVLPGGKAVEYGIGVGRRGFTWSGDAHIARKSEWPAWHPPQEMIEREKKQYGRTLPTKMEGGPRNPLGARALYLYQGKKDTLYRIHGTNAPWTIGHAVSSGCIRLVNEEVIDLHNRVKVGAKVIVR